MSTPVASLRPAAAPTDETYPVGRFSYVRAWQNVCNGLAQELLPSGTLLLCVLCARADASPRYNPIPRADGDLESPPVPLTYADAKYRTGIKSSTSLRQAFRRLEAAGMIRRVPPYNPDAPTGLPSSWVILVSNIKAPKQRPDEPETPTGGGVNNDGGAVHADGDTQSNDDTPPVKLRHPPCQNLTGLPPQNPHDDCSGGVSPLFPSGPSPEGGLSRVSSNDSEPDTENDEPETLETKIAPPTTARPSTNSAPEISILHCAAAPPVPLNPPDPEKFYEEFNGLHIRVTKGERGQFVDIPHQKATVVYDEFCAARADGVPYETFEKVVAFCCQNYLPNNIAYFLNPFREAVAGYKADANKADETEETEKADRKELFGIMVEVFDRINYNATAQHVLQEMDREGLLGFVLNDERNKAMNWLSVQCCKRFWFDTSQADCEKALRQTAAKHWNLEAD